MDKATETVCDAYVKSFLGHQNICEYNSIPDLVKNRKRLQWFKEEIRKALESFAINEKTEITVGAQEINYVVAAIVGHLRKKK